jgi:hypothetical protein
MPIRTMPLTTRIQIRRMRSLRVTISMVVASPKWGTRAGTAQLPRYFRMSLADAMGICSSTALM